MAHTDHTVDRADSSSEPGNDERPARTPGHRAVRAVALVVALVVVFVVVSQVTRLLLSSDSDESAHRELSGVVVYDGAPVLDADVRIEDADGDTVVESFRVRDDGTFRLSGDLPDRVLVIASGGTTNGRDVPVDLVADVDLDDDGARGIRVEVESTEAAADPAGS